MTCRTSSPVTSRRHHPLSACPRAIHLLLLLFAMISAGCVTPGLTRKYDYPVTPMGTVIDDYHGIKIADPYRWLEDGNSARTKTWVKAQNRRTSAFLAAIPERETIRARLTRLYDYPRYSVPDREADRYFFSKNDGLQNQSVLYVQKGLDGPPSVVIDPNRLSKDGTVALTGTEVSRDGKLLAYALSKSGSDWQEVRIRRVDSHTDYPEVIQWCRFSGIAWKKNSEGFFYNRFPEPGAVAKEDENNFNRVYWHQLGTPQSQDVLLYERPDAKELTFHPTVTDDGKYLILHVSHGTDPKNRVYFRETESAGPFVRLLDQADARYDFVGNVGPVFYFHTDLDAPRGRIIAIDTQKPARETWREILPQQDDVIAFVAIVNHRLVVAWMHDVHHLLRLYTLDGRLAREIELPTLGTIAGLSGKPDDTEMFFGFTSFLYPATIFRYDFKTDKLAVFRKPEIRFDPSPYETRQVFYRSKDGTRVPMFITHKKGIALDGNNPTLLYGYGGFNIEIMPFFSVPLLVWLEQGGVYAVANLRGGNEYGETWHQAGMLARKQNVFDDFIAAAEWLIQNEYTRPSRLAIHGRSNGGLLVAACMVQRPELYGAVVCQVPVTDMLRYHKFTVGRYWIPEYGNAEAGLEQFKVLYAYSPLHNVKAHVAYPPILVMTADTDDRVVPSHGRKLVATLQAVGGENPVFLRVETKAGHGHGKPMSKVIEEQSDVYGFLFKQFGLTWRE